MKANHNLNNVVSDSGVREKISATLFDGEPRDKFDAAARNSFLDSVLTLMQQQGGQFLEVH